MAAKGQNALARSHYGTVVLVAAALALDNWVATTLVFAPPSHYLLLEQRRFRGDRRRRAADRTSRRLEAWQIAGLVLGIVSAKALPDAVLPGNAWLWVGVGCGISVAGIALRLWAIRTLGTHFTRYLQVAVAPSGVQAQSQRTGPSRAAVAGQDILSR